MRRRKRNGWLGGGGGGELGLQVSERGTGMYVCICVLIDLAPTCDGGYLCLC